MPSEVKCTFYRNAASSQDKLVLEVEGTEAELEILGQMIAALIRDWMTDVVDGSVIADSGSGKFMSIITRESKGRSLPRQHLLP